MPGQVFQQFQVLTAADLNVISAQAAGAVQIANNLGDLSDVTASRANLGLGSAAVLNVGTITGTVAAGDDPRFITGGGGGLQPSNNLSDVGDASTSATNLGLGTASTPTFGGLTVAGTSSASFFTTPGGTITLAGSTSPTRLGQFSANYAGASTTTGNTTLANVNIGSASYAVSAPDGTFNQLLIIGHTAAGFDGGLTGAQVQLILNAPTTLTKSTSGLFGIGAKVVGSANAGGVSSGFGTTQFGLGSLFGANPWAQMTSGGTFYSQCVGEEVDASIGTGASAANFAVQQLVLTRDHAVHGVVKDVMLSLSAQIGTAIGVRNIIGVGDYSSRYPGDPNGYVLQVQRSEDGGAATAAGGLDLNQLLANGTGAEGGGFYWRSPNVKILSGEIVAGNGSMASSGAGLVIDAPYQQMSAAAGAITVAVGGTGFTTGDVATDAYGNTVVLTASAGVVTGVSTVVTQGWQKSPPSNPVAFTARTRLGAALGTGLSLNLAWTAAASLSLLPSGGAVGIGGGSANILTITPGSTSSTSTTLALSGTGNLQLTGTAPTAIQAPSFAVPGHTYTLASTAMTPLMLSNVTFAGTLANSTNAPFQFTVSGDTMDTTANKGSGNPTLAITRNCGGTGTVGGRSGIKVVLHVTGPMTTVTTDFITAIVTQVRGSANAGGTGPGGASAGSLFGSNPQVTVEPGATFYSSVNAMGEADITVTGSTQPVTLGGTVTTGDTLTVTFTSTSIFGSPISAVYTVGASNTLAMCAQALAALINNNPPLTAAGIAAQGSGSVLSLFWPTQNTVTPTVSVGGAATETMTLGTFVAGGCVDKKLGASIVRLTGDTTRGMSGDAVLLIDGQGDSPVSGQWTSGIIFGNGGGGNWPMMPTSTLFGALVQQGNNGTNRNAWLTSNYAAFGIDLRTINFSQAGGASLAMPGWSVDGLGIVNVSNAKIGPATGGLAIDIAGQRATVAVATGGSGTAGSINNRYYPNDLVYDAFGGQYAVATVDPSTGRVTALTTIIAPVAYGTPPSNPLSTTGGSGSGLTLTATWAANNTLSFNPSGGAVKFGSGCFTANGAVATALSSVGPTGSHTTVQEWLTFTNASGAIRYIPAF